MTPAKPKIAKAWFEWFKKHELSLIDTCVMMGLPEDAIMGILPISAGPRLPFEPGPFTKIAIKKSAVKTLIDDEIARTTKKRNK